MVRRARSANSVFLALALLGGCAHSPQPASPAVRGEVVAIFGDSRSCDYDPQGTHHRRAGCSASERALATGINVEVLSTLFSLVRSHAPRAVFFTGDLALGYEREDDAAAEAKTGAVTSPAAGHWAKEGFAYGSLAYQKQLDAFLAILRRSLGAGIPFYPGLGNHEAVGPDSIQLLRARFPLPGAAPIDGDDSLAYSIDVGSAHFAMIATDIYVDRRRENKDGLEPHTVPRAQLDWLRRDLEKNRAKQLFVLAHDPLWPASGLPGKGLDQHPEVQGELAEILKTNGVRAFICGHDHLYARFKHDGIWQIISGGAGAPLRKLPPPDPKDPSPAAIHHYVLLTLPEGGAPEVEVRDERDRVWDRFRLD